MKKVILIGLFALFIVACAATTSEINQLESSPTAVLPTKPSITVVAITEEEIVDETQPADEEPEGVQSEPVDPTEVDLSEMTPSPIASSEPREMPAPGVPNSVPGSLGELINRTIADLSEQLGVAEQSITPVRWEEVVWRDGSIGCPQPDMMYTMALVDGHRIVLAYDGQEYFYHTRGTDSFILCKNPQK